MLLNPKKLVSTHPDPVLAEVIRKTVDFFEAKGKKKLLEDDFDRVWYQDFIDFVKKEKIFARLLTPAAYGGPGCRWDTSRNAAYSEILGFYGLCYWYVWQVTILGLGPIWMSDNEALKKKAAKLLDDGAIFAFGLSEKEHGADIYSSDMLLLPKAPGTYLARGDKYYIGNGNEAAMVSTFGRIPKDLGPAGDGTGGKLGKEDEYVFFAVNSKHEKYECVKNITATQSYVAEYRLNDYPVTDADILSRGPKAWDCSLNTVNIGKYNLGWASIGICTHAFYEAINHASNRGLYNMKVTDFPHVQRMFVDAWARLLGMRLFAQRAADYMRSASSEDRRYLLFNPVVKMKVTTQGEQVIDLLWDVIAAKGFEKDMYFEVATRDIRALPKLEGTVHVNIALIIKFMSNYLFNPKEYAAVPRREDEANDDFLFDQGPTRGLGKIQFEDYRKAYDAWDLPNLRIFKEQIKVYKEFLVKATPDEKQQKDIDFLLTGGEIFTLIVYGQLILENAKMWGLGGDVVDQIFDFMVRDFSKFALQLHEKPSSSAAQMEIAMRMIRKPAVDEDRFRRVLKEHVFSQKDVYEMRQG